MEKHTNEQPGSTQLKFRDIPPQIITELIRLVTHSYKRAFCNILHSEYGEEGNEKDAQAKKSCRCTKCTCWFITGRWYKDRKYFSLIMVTCYSCKVHGTKVPPLNQPKLNQEWLFAYNKDDPGASKPCARALSQDIACLIQLLEENEQEYLRYETEAAPFKQMDQALNQLVADHSPNSPTPTRETLSGKSSSCKMAI